MDLRPTSNAAAATKIGNPAGCFWRAPGCVAPQSQSAAAMLLRRALPAARQTLSHPFPIYEIGS